MRHLHRLQTLILFCLVMVPLSMSAQYSKGNHNYREFSDKAYYFGLTFGYNSSNFELSYSKNFIRHDSFNIVEGLAGSGLNVSMIANMKLGDYFDFRFLPGFSFVNHKIHFLGTGSEEKSQIKDLESVLGTSRFPGQIQIRSFS